MGKDLTNVTSNMSSSTNESYYTYLVDFRTDDFYNIRSAINQALLALVLIALFGNIMILIVMKMEHNRKSSMSVFFQALAVSDILLVVFLPLERWVSWVKGVTIYGLSPILATVKIVLNYSVIHCSSWILVCITIERVLSVTVPLKIKTTCTMKTAAVSLAVLSISTVTINTIAFTMLVELFYHEIYGMMWASRVKYGIQVVQCWDFCMSFLIPFAIILIGSVVIVTQLARVAVKKHDKKKSRNNPITARLLAANIAFIMTMSPFNLVFMATWLSDYQLPHNIYYMATDLLLFISDLNAALNFFVYCLSGTRFRTDVKNVLCCKRK